VEYKVPQDFHQIPLRDLPDVCKGISINGKLTKKVSSSKNIRNGIDKLWVYDILCYINR